MARAALRTSPSPNPNPNPNPTLTLTLTWTLNLTQTLTLTRTLTLTLTLTRYDGTLDDLGHLIPGHDWDGCSAVRQIDTIAIHAHNAAAREPEQTYDEAGAADGLLGGILPTAVFYLPMRPNG